MTPKEIQVLNRACQMAGIDSSKIRPENPFSKSGGTAQILQAAVGEIDPQQAARWRVDAGGGLSVATLSEMQSGGSLSPQAMQDLYLHDAQFIADQAQQQQQAEEQTLAMFEAEADRMRRARYGDRAVDAQIQKDAAAEESRIQSAKHAREMEQRIEQQRIQSAQLAGRLIN